MKCKVYDKKISFKGIEINFQIIPDENDCYQLLMKSNEPLTIEDRSAFRQYLHQEGYIDEAFKTYF